MEGIDLSAMQLLVNWIGEHAEGKHEYSVVFAVSSPSYPWCPCAVHDDINGDVCNLPRDLFNFWCCHLQGVVCRAVNNDYINLKVEGGSTETRKLTLQLKKRVEDELLRVWNKTYPSTMCYISQDTHGWRLNIIK